MRGDVDGDGVSFAASLGIPPSRAGSARWAVQVAAPPFFRGTWTLACIRGLSGTQRLHLDLYLRMAPRQPREHGRQGRTGLWRKGNVPL